MDEVQEAAEEMKRDHPDVWEDIGNFVMNGQTEHKMSTSIMQDLNAFRALFNFGM